MDGADDLRAVLKKYAVSSIDSLGGGGWTPLMTAVAVSDYPSVRVLLDHGANLDIVDDEGFTALHLAASFAVADMTLLLLEHGADMNIVDSRGFTPLMAAQAGERMYKGSVTGALFTDVRQMLEAKAADPGQPLVKPQNGARLSEAFNKYGLKTSVDESNDTRWTGLMSAIVSDDLATAKLFIDNGANIETRDVYDRTPLFLAVENLKPEMVRLLLERGADHQSGNSAGRRPIDYARAHEGKYPTAERNAVMTEIIRLLETPPPRRRPGRGRKWEL